MNTDIVIIGAGPAGIFTAMELLRRGSKEKILLLEKGRSIETRISHSIICICAAQWTFCTAEHTCFCRNGAQHLFLHSFLR